MKKYKLTSLMRKYPKWYIEDRQKYLKLYRENYGADLVFNENPQLNDMTSDTGFDAHYTYQGPWVMRKLIQEKPIKHIDVGSWVAYLGFFSALQSTEFVDIRPAKLNIPGLISKEGSVLELPYKPNSVTSLSCLHVVEHVGLGRYGDPLDPAGTIKAIKSLAGVIAKGGNLYLSLPVGEEITYFNAHRVTDPRKVEKMCSPLKLKQLSAVLDDGTYIEDSSIEQLVGQKYALGLYHFYKKS